MMDAKDITGLVLAGGRGLRMGGADKGLQRFQGVPLALHALNRLRTGGGVGPLAINANRHLQDYEALGFPVWPDANANYAGPLAGFLTGLAHCQTPYLLTVPCDVPLFPLDLAQRLATALETECADLAIAVAPQSDGHGRMPLRSQPVFCLMRVRLLPGLSQFIQSGKHKVQDWCDLHATALARFDQPADHPQAFCNVNTLSELHQLENPTP
ncbi:MAG TPA: molybdenum cofactor guanylyltransferase MobA [Rhodoferax sp.]